MAKILVVDDDHSLSELYREELEDEGYEVVIAGDGQTALDMIDAEEYDLVTLDIKMPGIDGLETLKRIKQKEKNAPVILVSAYSTFKQDFNSWVAEDYVVKSADVSELKKKIRALLHS